MTIQTDVLVETLQVIGATVGWASCNIFSPQGHVAVGSAEAGTATVQAWRGETPLEYWWRIVQTLTVPGVDGGGQIGDGGGDALLKILTDTELEAAFTEDGTKPDPESTINPKV